MVKINAAWFNRAERGTFAGIFGFMIQLGQFAINNLAPLLLGGFTLVVWTAAKDDWHWLFRIPPLFVARRPFCWWSSPRKPGAGGLSGVVHDEATEGDAGTRATLRESFVTIFMHPLVWFMRLPTAALARCAIVQISFRCCIS